MKDLRCFYIFSLCIVLCDLMITNTLTSYTGTQKAKEWMLADSSAPSPLHPGLFT